MSLNVPRLNIPEHAWEMITEYEYEYMAAMNVEHEDGNDGEDDLPGFSHDLGRETGSPEWRIFIEYDEDEDEDEDEDVDVDEDDDEDDATASPMTLTVRHGLHHPCTINFFTFQLRTGR